MNGRVFLDTNVFVYTQSKGEPAKRDIALKTIEKYDCYTSTQVFNEICSVLLKKLKMSIIEVGQIIRAVNDRWKYALSILTRFKKRLA